MKNEFTKSQRLTPPRPSPALLPPHPHPSLGTDEATKLGTLDPGPQDKGVSWGPILVPGTSKPGTKAVSKGNKHICKLFFFITLMALAEIWLFPWHSPFPSRFSDRSALRTCPSLREEGPVMFSLSSSTCIQTMSIVPRPQNLFFLWRQASQLSSHPVNLVCSVPDLSLFFLPYWASPLPLKSCYCFKTPTCSYHPLLYGLCISIVWALPSWLYVIITWETWKKKITKSRPHPRPIKSHFSGVGVFVFKDPRWRRRVAKAQDCCSLTRVNKLPLLDSSLFLQAGFFLGFSACSLNQGPRVTHFD